MSDLDHDKEFDQAFEGFGEDEKPTPSDDSKEEPKDDPVQEDGGKDDTEPEKTEEESKDNEKTEEKSDSPSTEDEKKEDEEDKSSEDSKSEEEKTDSEDDARLTKQDVAEVIKNVRDEERNSAKELDSFTEEVLEKYYPDGLSNVLEDSNGKQLKTPQDVVEATNGEMTTEEATQWLMNEQYKLDQSIAQIKKDARNVAETTINFRRDATLALQKYEPLFKAYPYLQEKVFNKLMKQVNVDKEKNVILSSPDVMEHYDDYLEPYQLAFEHSQGQPGTNPTTPEDTEEPPKPSTDDRLDEAGDGGATPPNDPNDFAQQVDKELAKGI